MRHYTVSTGIRPASTTIPLVRWIFERKGDAITCEIDMNEEHTCDVAVIPHWNAASSVVEHFNGPMGAMERHAELAMALREEGWTLTDRV
jgi:hypothetical protein